MSWRLLAHVKVKSGKERQSQIRQCGRRIGTIKACFPDNADNDMAAETGG